MPEEENKISEIDPKLINPLDQVSETNNSSQLIQNIVSNETSGVSENILGKAPVIDNSLLEDVEPPTSVFLIVLKLAFGLLIGLSLASIIFFTSQLTNAFNFFGDKFSLTNISKDLAAKNLEIIDFQTNLNFFRYLQIKSNLDELSYNGDIFVQNFDTIKSITVSEEEKEKAKKNLEEVKVELKKSFEEVSNKYKENFTATLVDVNYSNEIALQQLYIDKLKEQFTNKIASLNNNTDKEAQRVVKNYRQILNLIGNSAIKDLILKTDFSVLKDEDIYKFIKDLNSSLVNDLTVISSLKNKMIKWSDIINEIELRTIAVDKHYNENFYNALGGIRYSSYDFDKDRRNISIVGETKRYDTKNFSMIADLIDEFNGSNFFKNGEMKSFSKNGSLDDGFMSTLKLTLDLEEGKIVEEKNITNVPEFLNQ